MQWLNNSATLSNTLIMRSVSSYSTDGYGILKFIQNN